MNRSRFIAVLAVAALSLIPLRADEASEKVAIDGFKKEVEALQKWVKEQEPTAKANPIAGLGMVRTVVQKAKAVKIDGLPSDLAAGYKEFTGVLTKMGALFTEWPEKEQELTAFIIKKSQEDPAFMEKFGTDMQKIQTEMEPVTKKLDELGKKYGLESLGKIGK